MVGVLAAAGLLLAFTKKGKKITKKVGKLVLPDSFTSTPEGESLKKGSADEQHVMQLQQVLNSIHAAAQYINKTCGTMQWGVFPGGLADVSGTFDDKTAQMSQFYLNRQEVDLDYLDEVREKIRKYNAGDKCKYPLSY